MENTLKTKTVNEMSNEEISRWLCLFDAVNYVAGKAEKMGNWIKPLAFKNYITEMYQSTYVNYKMDLKENTKDALHT